MPCELKVNPLRTKDHRRICGKAGKFYTVAGAVGSLVLLCCSRHARRLEAIGLDVQRSTPLEAAAFKDLRERQNSFCSCAADPYTCPIEIHAIKARQAAAQEIG